MKKIDVALIVHRKRDTMEDTISYLLEKIEDAAGNGAKLVLLSETALSGFITDDPAIDLTLALEKNHIVIDKFRELSKKYSIYIGLGYLEKDENKLYDSALLINNFGEDCMHYRRLSKGWRDYTKPDTVYHDGDCLPVCSTLFGNVSFVICGDLFSDEVVQLIDTKSVDFILFPYARSLANGERSQKSWNKVFPDYVSRVKKVGVTTFGVNYIDENHIGGAFVIDGDGNCLKTLSVDCEDILYFSN